MACARPSLWPDVAAAAPDEFGAMPAFPALLAEAIPEGKGAMPAISALIRGVGHGFPDNRSTGAVDKLSEVPGHAFSDSKGCENDGDQDDDATDPLVLIVVATMPASGDAPYDRADVHGQRCLDSLEQGYSLPLARWAGVSATDDQLPVMAFDFVNRLYAILVKVGDTGSIIRGG